MRTAVELVCGEPSTCAVLLDFDGTLAHIVDHPADAEALPGAAEALSFLVPVVARVGLVSGRPVGDLRARLDVDGLHYSGLYGLERAVGGDEILVKPEAAPWAPEVGFVTEAARTWVTGGGAETEGLVVESKGLSVTLHYRLAPDQDRALEAVREWAQGEAARTGMRVIFGKLNVELVPPVDSDKGSAVRDLIEGFNRCLYVGDDSGDLPAFEALRRWTGKSLAVAVESAELPDVVASSADLTVAGPGGVVELLSEIVQGLRGGRA